MVQSATDRIEKSIEIHAPMQRVWEAITDYRQFSQWFRVNLETAFVVGEKSSGQITYPGYEHVRMEVMVTAIEPIQYFAFQWHPYAVDPNTDYSSEPPTLVEFRLKMSETAADGSVTLLEVSESGFDALPASRRDEAFRMNEGGWSAQINNIRDYVQQDD